MDRREAIKTAAALTFASVANATLITPPLMSSKRLEDLSLEWNQQRSLVWLSANEVRDSFNWCDIDVI